MNTLTGSSFYVQKPQDQYWNTGCTGYVIEAVPLDIKDNETPEFMRTQEYADTYLKVINPPKSDFSWRQVLKSNWIECSGPVRKLNFKEYTALYHSLRPNHPLPK